MKIQNRIIFGIFFIVLTFLTCFLTVDAKGTKGQSTEDIHNAQVEKDDEILAKDPSTLTKEEQKRLTKIQKAQVQKRSLYEKRAIRKLSNTQPKTYDEYERMSQDIDTSDLQDFNPKFVKDPFYAKVPAPEFEVLRYNYPAGSREINLSNLKVKRHARSIGVLSPDYKYVVYSDVNYDVGMRKASTDVYLIPTPTKEVRAKRRIAYLEAKEKELRTLNEELTQNKRLASYEKKNKKRRIKQLQKEIEEIKVANQTQNKLDEEYEKNDTPSQKAGRILLESHIKDRIKTPILSTGLYDMNYGVQRTLTVIDWSKKSDKILIKERISKDGDGTWQTNIWVYDMETKETKKLDEIRQAIEYYWNKNRLIDLYYYRFDIYPLGWDAQHPDRILLYAYGYNKENELSPKFLGTWSIDYKGEQSHLVSVTKTGYVVQANGFCLKTKNLGYYEK